MQDSCLITNPKVCVWCVIHDFRLLLGPRTHSTGMYTLKGHVESGIKVSIWQGNEYFPGLDWPGTCPRNLKVSRTKSTSVSPFTCTSRSFGWREVLDPFSANYAHHWSYHCWDRFYLLNGPLLDFPEVHFGKTFPQVILCFLVSVYTAENQWSWLVIPILAIYRLNFYTGLVIFPIRHR